MKILSKKTYPKSHSRLDWNGTVLALESKDPLGA